MTDKNTNITIIGAEIRQRRINKKYSQRQLARKIGVDKSTISAWERDVRFPNEDHLLSISNILGFSIHYLLIISKNRKMAG